MNYLSKRILTSIILTVILFLSLNSSIILFLLLITLNLLSLAEFSRIFKNIFYKKKILICISIFFSIIYLSFFSLIIWLHLLSSDFKEVISLVFVLIICISSDIGGFVFGKLIGGKKITKISPNKTYSGVIGSFLFAIILSYFLIHFYKNILIFNIEPLLIIFIISLISQIGDLTISFLKRKAKMKDSGTILPGHGGILDRIDGILLALPLGIMLVSL